MPKDIVKISPCYIILYFFSFRLSYMIENNLEKELKFEKVINRAMSLFRQTGLAELAEKFDKILKNYKRQKIVR